MKIKNARLVSDLHLGSDVIAEYRGFKASDTTTAADNFWYFYKTLHNSQVTYLTQPVFILGDIAIDKYWLSKLSELKGRLHLVLGNHDILPLDDYQEIVKPSGGSVNAMVMLPHEKIILSHIPVHPSFFGGNKSDWMNIHGHAHTEVIEDLHYSNVSFDQVQIQLNSQQLFRL